MSKKIKIWTLNAAEKLLSDPRGLLQELTYVGQYSTREVDPAVFSWDEIEAGNRRKFENSIDIIITQNGVSLFIIKMSIIKSFGMIGCGPGKLSRMITKNYMGYYGYHSGLMH